MENRQQILLSKQLVTVDTQLPIDVEWDDFKVQPPDRSALMPLLKELEFINLIKEYLPPEAGPLVEVIHTDTIPDLPGNRVVFDVRDDRVSFWTGEGPVFSVPLDANRQFIDAKDTGCFAWRRANPTREF